jgi:hypothetical protein
MFSRRNNKYQRLNNLQYCSFRIDIGVVLLFDMSARQPRPFHMESPGISDVLILSVSLLLQQTHAPASTARDPLSKSKMFIPSATPRNCGADLYLRSKETELERECRYKKQRPSTEEQTLLYVHCEDFSLSFFDSFLFFFVYLFQFFSVAISSRSPNFSPILHSFSFPFLVSYLFPISSAISSIYLFIYPPITNFLY